MAVTPDIQSPQGAVLAAYRSVTPALHSPQGTVLSVYNKPTKHMHATQAAIGVTMHRRAENVRVPQAVVMAVVSGRKQNPAIRAFTFTLDGHDFYGLRLGDASTVLYDFSSQEWVEWTSETYPFWRVNTAMNWIGGQQIGYVYGGTDIVVGDDTWGLLYFLDPTQAFDQSPNSGAALQQIPFPRVVMAQTLVPAREHEPCYVVFLGGDNYGLTAQDFTPSVQLETSDDQGQSWLNHGVITLQPDTNDQDYRWYSLGDMHSPGRLFRVTDNGILSRIDSLEMNDAQ